MVYENWLLFIATNTRKNFFIPNVLEFFMFAINLYFVCFGNILTSSTEWALIQYTWYISLYSVPGCTGLVNLAVAFITRFFEVLSLRSLQILSNFMYHYFCGANNKRTFHLWFYVFFFVLFHCLWNCWKTSRHCVKCNCAHMII